MELPVFFCSTIIWARPILGYILGPPWGGMLEFVQCFGHIVMYGDHHFRVVVVTL